MNFLLDLLFGKNEESDDWTISRLRALEDKRIGPRFPTGMFSLYNPHDERVTQ
jgi:hypothetical protein